MKTMQFKKLSSVLVLGSALIMTACTESETEAKEEAATVITEQVLADVAATETVVDEATEAAAEAVEEVAEVAEVTEEAAEAVEETAEDAEPVAEEITSAE